MAASAAEKYDFWRPRRMPEERRRLDAVHADIAAGWRRQLLERLGLKVPISFLGSRLETFAAFRRDGAQAGWVILLDSPDASAAGLIMVSIGLARRFVRLRLGEAAATAEVAERALSRLESAIVKETVGLLFDHLSSSYHAAELLSLRRGAARGRLPEVALFRDSDPLIIFRYSVAGLSQEASLIVAVRQSQILAGRAAKADDPPSVSSARTRDLMNDLPIETEVVLGEWTVPAGELIKLRPGDLIVLPGADEAILMAGGRRLQRLTAQVESDRVCVRTILSPGRNGKVRFGS